MLALVAWLPSCGSGSAAAIFGSEGGGSTVIETPFEINLDESSPVLYPTLAEANAATVGGVNIPGIFLRFRFEIEPDSVEASDFLIQRLQQVTEIPVETLQITQINTTTNSITLNMLESLALNGKYRVEMVGDIRDIRGRSLAGSRVAFVRIADGQYSFSPETVTFGQTTTGGVTMGVGNRSFASIEAALGSELTPFMVGASTAPRDGLWESPALVYLGESNPFKILQTGSISINKTAAILPIQEGRIRAVHQDSEPIIVKAFPATISNIGRPNWGEPTISSVGPTRYQVDQAVPGSPLAGNHLSFRGSFTPIDPSQLNNSSGVHLATWWAWSNEFDDSEFLDYGVYLNILDLDSAAPGQAEWAQVDQPLSGSDISVGWPYTSTWPDGRAVVLWNDAEDDLNPNNANGRRRVFEATVPSYGLVTYDHDNGGLKPVAELFENGDDLSRATAIRTFSNDGLLVISRLDRSSEGAGLASIGARTLRFDAGGELVQPGSAIQTAPEPSGRYNSPLGYGGFNGKGLPLESEYFQFRRVAGKGPQAARIDGSRFLISWTAEGINPGEASPIVGLFDTTGNRWADSVLNLRTLIGATSPSGEVIVRQVLVDRLGYATVFWSESVDNIPTGIIPPIRLFSLRSQTSLLAVDLNLTSGPDSVAAAFEGAEPDLIVEPLQEPSFTIIPTFPGISNVDSSGQFIVSWEEFILSDNILSSTGTRAKRFGQL